MPPRAGSRADASPRADGASKVGPAGVATWCPLPTPVDIRDNPIILWTMLSEVSPEGLGAKVTGHVYERAVDLSRAVGAQITKPRSARVATEVERVTRYAQGTGAKLSNKEVQKAIEYVI